MEQSPSSSGGAGKPNHYLGNSKSAAKRRANRHGICRACGKGLPHECNRKTTRARTDVLEYVKMGPTRFRTERTHSWANSLLYKDLYSAGRTDIVWFEIVYGRINKLEPVIFELTGPK
ncbi:RNA-binding protein [Pineapple vitivirus A]|uniref:RNA-binding protein n=1 Tax=Pineapple vitivirus A TaxID=2967992 RepID=A0AAE9N5S5_9VIRU|nr:RNA-binding protein [Pineapple vitivirus A]